MANIAYTEYAVEGQTDSLLRLKQLMDDLAVPSTGSDEELSNSLDRLVTAAGGNPSGIECRGFWKPFTLRMENGILLFEVESKWVEPSQWRAFIEKTFNVRMFYYTEQLGELILKTNDAKGCHFPYRYYFNGSSDSPYFETIDELCEDVGDLTGEEDLSTFEDCSKAVSNYLHDHLDETIILSKITVTN